MCSVHMRRTFVLQSPNGNDIYQKVGDGSAAKRRRSTKAGHFLEVVLLTHFCKVILTPGLNLLPIPPTFCQHLGSNPRDIVLKTNTGYNWKVNIIDHNDNAAMDQDWPVFSIVHRVNIGCFLPSSC